jgi:hypothetical protein
MEGPTQLLAFAAMPISMKWGSPVDFPGENAPNGNMELLAKFDTVADPGWSRPETAGATSIASPTSAFGGPRRRCL